mmetsp:Transcript_40819/g.89271  ORF Transcript_40819/g.89271 Transcript_40819/m.89271 type:complete len:550 (+) Transcript_40819:102-1751(+)
MAEGFEEAAADLELPEVDPEEADALLAAELAASAEDGAEAEEDPDAQEAAEAAEADEAADEILPDGDADGDAEADEEEGDEVLDEDGVEVQEHLKDAVEGSLRLKRLLSRDDGEAGAAKKQKLSPEQEKANQIITKWGLQADGVVKHVLEGMTLEELQAMSDSGYAPDRFNMWKSASELLARYVGDMRERKGPGGGPLDAVSTFKFRWKIDMEGEKLLRTLCHKDLRYVMANYDGNTPLADVVAEAASVQPEDNSTENALPEAPGAATMGRFGRLELIDPLADAAVFGDANLTFALKLAKHRKALGHVGRVIATTFEELDTLRERYKEIDESIATLEEHYAEVYHGVDCTRIALDPRFEGMEGSLGAVYYNFPHSGAIQGFFDGHPIVNWRHENLMRLFFRALRSFVKPGGVVKVSSNMGAVGVRYSYIVSSGIENEFMHSETIPFMDWHLHRYGRSYGDKRDAYKRPDAKNNQSYNSQRAEADMVYCFTYTPSGDTLPKQTIRLPPSLKTLKACTDGPFKNLQGLAKESLVKSLHKRFVTEISGTHVG